MMEKWKGQILIAVQYSNVPIFPASAGRRQHFSCITPKNITTIKEGGFLIYIK